MVTAELTSATAPEHAAPPLSRRAVLEELLAAYGIGWLLLAAAALPCALSATARWLAHQILGLTLDAPVHLAPPPRADAFMRLLVENVRATCWPLIPVLLRGWQLGAVRRVVDGAVLVSVAANLLPVGAALGIHQLRLAPYLPHLPLELYAVTGGASCWRFSSRRDLGADKLGALVASIVLALVGGAALETWAVPHRP